MQSENLGAKLREIRESRELSLRKVAGLIKVDTGVLSKMERGERKISVEVIKKLAKLYKHDENELMVLYLSDKILNEVGENTLALKALKVAEEKLQYIAAPNPVKPSTLKILKKYFASDKRINSAWMFGSFARGEETGESDIDLMLSFNLKKRISLFDMAEIQYLLEKKVNRKIDLVEEGCLSPLAMKTAKKDLVKIFG